LTKDEVLRLLSLSFDDTVEVTYHNSLIFQFEELVHCYCDTLDEADLTPKDALRIRGDFWQVMSEE